MQNDSLNSSKVLLADFLVKNAPPEIARLVSAAVGGIKSIARAMRTSSQLPGSNLSGYSAHQNVQGETQAELDIYSDKVMTEAFFGSGVVAALVSEEQPELILGGVDSAPFVVAHDPLDGSSNIPFNIPVGTIFAVFRRASVSNSPKPADYFQGEKGLVCAGYGVYGLKTQFVCTWGSGVIDTVLNESTGEFEVLNSNLSCKADGTIFSVNEGASSTWAAPVQKFIKELKDRGSYSGRYVGSLVSDFDRNLRKGGIYLYPADKKNVRGKLRLLYECLPLSYICQQAGGDSFDGERGVLEVIPTAIHERSPLYLGAKNMVQELRAICLAG